ncbi:Scramblase [Linderina pennispora]|uniref:Phospholipid scramblase n=1 Tax=Linderina pennispora TaxID=61395 RepID=A0A1Y1WE60_9FUNG|nr:Scramblase [Linderina pennispora]ORX71811.1 Scramblase [Linderina pennispora]
MLNILLSYEQANRYALMDSQSNPVGFMLEHRTFAHELMRQAFRLHRPFKVDIVDLNGHLVMRAERKFSLVNSRVTISDHSGKVIGESQQEWHLWRRRYDLFTETAAGSERQQFARVDAPFLSWDFPMVDQSGEVMAGVFRDFAGIGMELFSDYGLYAICFDKLALAQRYQGEAASPQMADRDLNLDERAAVLAAAISIDFDYFSRHSRMGGGGFGFFPFFGGGSNELTDSQDIDIDT